MTVMFDMALRHILDGDLEAASTAIDTVGAEGDSDALVKQLLGRVALRRHDWFGAFDYFQAALQADRENMETWMCLGMAQFELGLFDEACVSFGEVIARNIWIAKAWLKLGASHGMMQRHWEAMACLERAVSIGADDPECHNGMAMMCATLGIEDGALHHYREAQRLQPGYVHAECGEAFVLLRSGQWLEGWKKFEARWRLPTPVAPWWYRGQALYTGDLEGLRGKRVLLRGEQGFGDSIHFCRYVPLVAEIAGEVILETQSELARLFTALPARIVVAKLEPTPEFDEQTSLMSLPLLFGTMPENVPPPAKFHVEECTQQAMIGVCWAGGPRPEDPQANAVDRRRSMTEQQFSPIIDAIEDYHDLPVKVLHKEFLPKCKDWQDTANLIAGLRLVITVDTAVAHLGASLGVETWMLSRFDACWRWGMTGTDTVWYPSMRIYRQPRLGDWDTVIRKVVSDLREWGA